LVQRQNKNIMNMALSISARLQYLLVLFMVMGKVFKQYFN